METGMFTVYGNFPGLWNGNRKISSFSFRKPEIFLIYLT